MCRVLLLTIVLALASVMPAAAMSVSDVASLLRSDSCYKAQVDYRVLMSLQDDVAYSLSLESLAAPHDTLAPCQYIVEWKAPDAPADASPSGFAAYADGHAYQYRGDRLIEYHFAENPMPFGVGRTGGVQRRAQFASMLPAFIADELVVNAGNPDWTFDIVTDTIIDGRHVVHLSGIMSRNGDVGREVFYTIDPSRGRLLSVRIESNPGALAEQTILADYTYPYASPCATIDESVLRTRYTDQFATMRDSQFAINSLVGRDMPQFALPTTTAERYAYHRGDGFRTTTIIVIADPVSQFTPDAVAAIRGAVDLLPFNVDVVWAFTSNNVDDIEAVFPRPNPGEHLLMGATVLARDCGAVLLPTLLFVSRDGRVAEIHQGFNNTLKEIVIEKATAIGR
ncbi:MAG: hypothetical protein K2M98_07035 [Muribaculum sp.]|nr:hypothetical protein [Muribaculum sp.]